MSMAPKKATATRAKAVMRDEFDLLIATTIIATFVGPDFLAGLCRSNDARKCGVAPSPGKLCSVSTFGQRHRFLFVNSIFQFLPNGVGFGETGVGLVAGGEIIA